MKPRSSAGPAARAALAAIAWLALAGADCERERITQPPAGRIVQSIRIEPAEPRVGEVVTVYSSVRNQGARSIEVELKDCGFGFAGDLDLDEVIGRARCLSFSHRRELRPGDSVESLDQMKVASSQGTYGLEVVHVLSPAITRPVLRVRVIE